MLFPGGSDGKESTCNVEDSGSVPGSGRSPVEGNDNPLQPTLAWRVTWTEEPGGLLSMASQRVQHDWVTNTITIRDIQNNLNQYSLLKKELVKVIAKKKITLSEHCLYPLHMLSLTFSFFFCRHVAEMYSCLLYNAPLLSNYITALTAAYNRITFPFFHHCYLTVFPFFFFLYAPAYSSSCLYCKPAHNVLCKSLALLLKLPPCTH